MATPTLISLQEYLTTVYEPECEYVDGVLEDRNVGEWDHGRLLTLLVLSLGKLEKQLGFRVSTDQRVQVRPTRFRVPDICVVIGPPPAEQILTKPPFLCVEILSPEDRLVRMRRRIADFLQMGVRYVWLIDPRRREAWIYSAEGVCPAKDGILRTSEPEIVIPLAEVFAEF